jgi:hypothetical protein
MRPNSSFKYLTHVSYANNFLVLFGHVCLVLMGKKLSALN